MRRHARPCRARALRPPDRAPGAIAFGPALRPVWALAAIAIAFGVMKIAPKSPPAGAPTLRGGNAHELGTAMPSYAAHGVTLVWSPNPEADHYQLRFFSTALTEIGRRDLARDTTVTLAIGDLPARVRGRRDDLLPGGRDEGWRRARIVGAGVAPQALTCGPRPALGRSRAETKIFLLSSRAGCFLRLRRGCNEDPTRSLKAHAERGCGRERNL